MKTKTVKNKNNKNKIYTSGLHAHFGVIRLRANLKRFTLFDI